MFFDIKQTQKGLFSADFSIVENEQIVGQMHLEGKMGSMEGQWQGAAFGKKFCMSYGKGNIQTGCKNVFRPYNIAFEEGIKGCVYQTEQKEGWFSKMEFHQLILDTMKYNMYPIGFGKEGSKNPIYIGDEQIALVEKESVVYDDLHRYRVSAIDENAAKVALVFVCYMYTNAGYKPGVKVVQSVSKTVSTTTNKKLKQKYDPTFVQRI